MKCIKNKVTNEIERVSNETAHNRVNSGKWLYCAKHEYKDYKKGQETIKQEYLDRLERVSPEGKNFILDL